MKGKLIVFLSLFLALQGNTQTTAVTALDSIVKNIASTFMKDPAKVGLSIGIIKNGEIYTYNYGTIEKGKDLTPTKNTIYEIGSISKTFTGTLLAKAIADKKLDLNDDVRKYLKEPYPNLAYQGNPVKIIHLVTHTAGLPSFLPHRPDLFNHSPDSIPLLLSAVHKDYTKNKFFKDLHTVKLDTIPGFNYKYSNVDAQLVGFILESVYNKPFAALIKEFITGPLSMTRTEVIIKNNMAAQMAKGHSATGKAMPSMPPLMAASGGIYSTVEDMLRYIRFHLDENNAVAVLSHQPVSGDTNTFAQGLFWRMNKTANGHLKIWHTGGTFGFSGFCVLYPKFNTGIILLTNELDMDSQGQLVSAADKIFESLF